MLHHTILPYYITPYLQREVLGLQLLQLRELGGRHGACYNVEAQPDPPPPGRLGPGLRRRGRVLGMAPFRCGWGKRGDTGLVRQWEA